MKPTPPSFRVPGAVGSRVLDQPRRERIEAGLDIAMRALCEIVASDSARRHFEIARKAIRDIETLREGGSPP